MKATRPQKAAKNIPLTCDIYSHVIAEAGQRNADILGDIFLKKA